MAPVAPNEAAEASQELAAEISNLERTAGEIARLAGEGPESAKYGLSLLLMNYYTGAERLFVRIEALFGIRPDRGERWHADLLNRMTLVVPSLRPAVITGETARLLRPLLGFRHVIRNLYFWDIDRAQVDRHVADLPAIHASLAADVGKFRSFLEALAEG
ncbi:MAG: antitoxin [Candidatus Sericytochromatia bacterium]|nr:antitoxin [Candidatus Tanganyikabacteria bacterium]